MPWYKEWFGEEYLELYSHRDEGEAQRHVDFVTQALGERADGLVLDLACGAGRHSRALRKRGFVTYGVDLSMTLLARSEPFPRAAGDMRCLPFRAASFTWVLNFFTSFGYFERERENFQVLEEITRVLRPRGRFLIDFLNRERVLEDLKPREVSERGGRRVTIERWYDQKNRRINKRMRLEATGSRPATYLESVRAYDRDEVTIGARWAGLEVDALYGNFDGEPYRRDSERLILVGHKPKH
ncbi:MAG: class I SAM-dependent methyltransferase [Thermoanaerobaculia bacterium]|nr:class I SAM-dependent methyltransferase [Thermoanaerobaculia bacterium]